MKKPWPRLSVQLTGPRHPHQCQRCGSECDLVTFRECDDNDQPENTFVILCEPCAEILVADHPRLYHDWPRYKPFPGIMAELCTTCSLRDGLTCTSPLLIVNGGPGMKITSARGTLTHWHGTDDQGELTGGIIEHYYPSTACTGRDLTQEPTNIITPNFHPDPPPPPEPPPRPPA